MKVIRCSVSLPCAVLLIAASSPVFAQDGARDALADAKARALRMIELAKRAGRVPLAATQLRTTAFNAHALRPGSDIIDYEKLVKDVFDESARRLDALRSQERGEKQRLEAAKRQYAVSRRAAGQAKGQAMRAFNAWAKGEKERLKKNPDKAQRKQDERRFKSEERDRKRAVHQAERDANHRAKLEWQKAQAEYKAFAEELKNARFEAKTMPKYEKRLRPTLLNELRDLNRELKKVTNEASTAGATHAVSISVIAALRPDVTLGFLKWTIGEKIRPKVEGGIAKSLDRLFSILDKVVSAIIKGVVAAVGSIPFVGGALAAVAAAAGEAIYSAVKRIVTNSVRKIGQRVSRRLIDGLGERLLKVVTTNDKKTQAVVAAALKAAEASNRHLDKANAQYAAKANAAQTQGYSLKADAAGYAKKLAAEAEAEHKSIAKGELDAVGGDAEGTVSQ